MVQAQVLENAEDMHAVVESRKSESQKIKIERTSEYVQSQIDLQNRSSSPLLPTTSPFHAESHDSFVTWRPPVKDISQLQPIKSNFDKADNTHSPAPNLSDPTRVETKSEVRRTNPYMNIHAQSNAPQQILPTSTPPLGEPLAQYLARRDLVNSGLYQFDDKPENDRAWYSSFTNAAGEVHLTATQELDIITKWLGKESGEQVKRIRSVHVTNPNLALHKAWERLRE